MIDLISCVAYGKPIVGDPNKYSVPARDHEPVNGAQDAGFWRVNSLSIRY